MTRLLPSLKGVQWCVGRINKITRSRVHMTRGKPVYSRSQISTHASTHHERWRAFRLYSYRYRNRTQGNLVVVVVHWLWCCYTPDSVQEKERERERCVLFSLFPSGEPRATSVSEGGHISSTPLEGWPGKKSYRAKTIISARQSELNASCVHSSILTSTPLSLSLSLHSYSSFSSLIPPQQPHLFSSSSHFFSKFQKNFPTREKFVIFNPLE